MSASMQAGSTIKHALRRHCLPLAGLAMVANLAIAQNWVSSGPIGKPVIPFDVIISGRDVPALHGLPGAPFYTCRGGGLEGYGTQLGRFRTGLTGCDIGYGGSEVIVPDFEFLVTSWQAESFGAVPSNAVIGGWDTPAPGDLFGPPLYFCRAQIVGSAWQPGKIRPGFDACYIPYGGAEYHALQYEVLVGLDPAMPLTQIGASGGYIPPDAIRGGTDSDGMPLYICIASLAGGTHPGKLKQLFKGCDVSYGGTEHLVSSYSVLVADWLSATVRAAHDFPAGADVNGTPLHVCRVYFNGAIYPGKTRTDWHTCNFGLSGKEEASKSFDLLSSPAPPR